jgi:hypothetical protein
MGRRLRIALAALAVGCTPPAAPVPRKAAVTASTAPTPTVAAPPAIPPTIMVTDIATMRALESAGYDLGSLLDAKRATDNASLSTGKRFANVVARLEQDLVDAKKEDPNSGVGMAKAHRLFDTRWLRSKNARFELVGVSNRLDRRPFAPKGTCGEIRLVYRLAYETNSKGTAIASRLPATIAFTVWVREDDCQAAAKRWLIPGELKGGALAAQLANGPLAPDRLRSFRSLEVNLQRVRWPSTIRPDLGGHAEYLLRVFHENTAGALFAAPLENTPDVALLEADPKRRAALLAFLMRPESVESLDRGTLLLPDEFLASKAISVSPRGLGRRANRPFRQLFAPSDFAKVSLADRANIASPSALLRRLDTLTCAGCHQSRSVAGFHLLGEETAPEKSANAISVARSPHLDVELVRRAELVAALARGDTVPDAVPFPERDPSGAAGTHCGLGDAGFAKWTCAAGLVCDAGEGELGDDVGTCLPKSPGVGDPCEVGRVTPNAKAHLDKIASLADRACGTSAVCETNRVGFPAGMCSTTCAAIGADGVCGGIPNLIGFNDCLGQNTPFETCIADNIRPAGLRACSSASPCRDDYVCARTASGKGACMPPYFLFQLRVDGHP